MSNLFFLTHREFSLQAAPGQNTQGNQQPQYDLIHRLPGISMVMFYSKSCSFCNTLKPVFSGLPGKVNGVHFALANVSADNMKLQEMSMASKTPITYVPFLAFYVNGMFYLPYFGPKTADAMARAAYEIANKVSTGRDFASGKICTTQGGQSGYCADGSSADDEDVCYLTVDEAYNGRPISSTGKGSHYTYGEIYGQIRI